MFNYNAREYNSSTYTFPKTQGQLFDEDLVLQGGPRAVYEDHLDMSNASAYMGKQYSTDAENPFNRNSSNNSFTFIYKTSGFTSGSNNLFGNRDNNYNYMVRGSLFHTSQSEFLNLTPSTYPEICLIRIYADGKSERKFLDSSGNVLKSTSASSISWGSESRGFAFFAGYRDGGEKFNATFYWMYCSLETLTDDEVKKVIAYNENTTTFVVTAAKNTAYAGRNGLVTVTNGEDVIEITVEQAKYPLFIPFENIYRADLEVIKGYRSGSTINKAYRSGELIYYKLDYSQPTPPVPPGPKETPLTFNVTSDGAIKWAKSGSAMQEKTILYKLNDGEWTSITSNSSGSAPSISVVSGDTIQFKGDNATYSTGSNAYTYFIASGATFTVSGNIMSLIDSTDFAMATVLTKDYAFCSLFKSCTGLTDASNLVLPATTLRLGCYRSLFDRCSHLTSGTELPATTLAQDCYRSMFFNCSDLTTAPELPATRLASSCYYYMFDGCSSLTTAPELPATTLASSCYQYMFAGCSSLTTAPELPATTLINGCYRYMFQSCTNLNYIKCLATDISASNCTNRWVANVAATGTFVTPSSTNWDTGTSGIPEGWTRVDA